MSKWNIKTLKEYFEKVITLKEEALRLQALEYERRLDSLNHAHEQAIEVQHTYLTRDKYDQDVKNRQDNVNLAFKNANDKFDTYITEQSKRGRTMLATLITMGLVIVGLGLTVIGLILKG